MPTEQRCGKCGAELAAFATEGFCSACLLERGLTGVPTAASPLRSFGDYELIEEIARGGMGVVYKARQAGLNRIVAVKMILSGQFASAAEMQRFRAEARAAAALQHPGIVGIHEVGEHEGLLYFSMDFVEGRNLAQLVRDGPWPAARAAPCLRDIAEAIHYAHEHGVLHRDLKPSNVLIDAEGKPHVTDFGLAKRMVGVQPSGCSDSPADPDRLKPELQQELTVSGQVLGSPNFMPPEQAAGKHRELTPAADVYSLGALLYHLLTGRPPFLADSIPATLRLVSETDPVAPRLLAPAVSRDLETICLKCLDKDPRRRYGTARELADELDRFLRDEPIRARPVGRWEKFHRWTRRHPVIAALTGIIGVLLVAVAVISTVAAARLQRANRDGQEKLREAYLSQARANRWSGRPGRRFDSLDVIRKATAIRPGLDLRNEAIAALALVDLREDKEWRLPPGVAQTFDAAYERYARFETNGTIIVRRVRDDVELLQVAGFGLPVRDFGFSPDGRRLGIYYSNDETLVFKVFDLRDFHNPILHLSNRFVRCFQFLPDNRRLALAWATVVQKKHDISTVTLYDLETRREMNSIPLPHLPYGRDAHPDASKLVFASPESPLVHIYSVADGRILQTLTHSNGVYGVHWSSDGRRLTTACGDQSVYVWNLSEEPPTVRLLPHEGAAIRSLFTQRGDLLLSWGWNQLAKIWNVESGRELLRFPAGSVGGFSADDRWLNVNRVPASVSISEFADARECRAYHYTSGFGGTHSVALSPDGRWMASGHRDGLRLWNLATGRASHYPAAGETTGLQRAPDGHSLITHSYGEPVSWPIRAHAENGTNWVEIGPPASLSREPPESIDPTNRRLAIAKGKAYVFDARSLRIERRLTDPRSLHAGAISPDGRQCATWPPNARAVDVWNADDGHHIVSLPVQPSPRIGFSPDGRWLITGSAEEYIFWDRASWKPHQRIPRGQTGGSHGRFAFPADGSMVALAVGRGEVGLFDTTTFETLATLESPEINTVSGLDFSADGAQLAVSTTVQSIHVWDLRLVRKQLAELKLDYASPPLPAGATQSGPLELRVTGAGGR